MTRGSERGRSSGVEHNLAKVGVEGSNPFARSKITEEFQTIRGGPKGPFLLPGWAPIPNGSGMEAFGGKSGDTLA